MSEFPPGYEYLSQVTFPVVSVICHDPSHAENPSYAAIFGKRRGQWTILDPSRIVKSALWSPDNPELLQAINPATEKPILPSGIGTGRSTGPVPLPPPVGSGTDTRYNIKCPFRIGDRMCRAQPAPIRNPHVMDRLHAILDQCEKLGVSAIPLTELAATLRRSGKR